jgi:hypothetical protein
VLAAAIAAAPIWIHGPVGADDFEFHLISWLDAQHSWLHGIPYPHWAADPNFGAGEPRFVFYPPLTWMMGAALGLLLPWAAMPFAMTFLLLAATGLATRALARTVLAEAPATLAGCAALFSGYALFTAYDRTAFGEMAGGLWIPLLLLFALSPLKQKSAWERQNLGGGNPIPSVWRRALDGSVLPLALVIAGCWLSDAPVGVMGSYLLAGVALAASIARRSWLPAVRAFVAAVLGVALTGAYLIPAAWEQRWVDIQQATGVKGDPGLRIENNWIFPHHADPALHARDLTLHWISWVNAAMIALALGSVLAFWLRSRVAANKSAESGDSETGSGPLQRSFWLPLAAIPAVVLLLQLPLSLPVWNLLPKLRFLQFPWRWLLVVEAPMGLFFAAAVWPRNSRSGRQRMIVAAVCALLFAGSTVFAAKNFFRDPKEDDDLATILENYRTGAGFVGTDEYAPPGAENTLVAQGLPDACLTDDFDDEQGVQPTPDASPIWRPEQKSCISTTGASPTSRPEHMRVSTNALRAGFLVLKLRRYPAWRITVNGRAVSGLQPRDDGLISVPVPQGPVSVTVDWATTPDVIIGRWVSALALAMLIALGLVERRNRRQA